MIREQGPFDDGEIDGGFECYLNDSPYDNDNQEWLKRMVTRTGEVPVDVQAEIAYRVRTDGVWHTAYLEMCKHFDINPNDGSSNKGNDGTDDTVLE